LHHRLYAKYFWLESY